MLVLGHRLGIDIPSMIHHTCKECGEQWSDSPQPFTVEWILPGGDMLDDFELWSKMVLPKCSCGCPELDEVAEFPDGSRIQLTSSEKAISDMRDGCREFQP
jgi:hypothetical protein